MNQNQPKTITGLTVLVFLAFSFFFPSANSLAADGNDEKIVEKVVVENITVPVRVFDGDKPVEGLEKKDFQLIINGQRHNINGFYSMKKKLELIEVPASGQPAPQPAVAPKPRLFTLIFNITDFKMDVDTYINTLFARVIRPNDRIIVITNRFFFPEWVVTSPEQTKKKLKEILQKEIDHFRHELLVYENEVKALGAVMLSKLGEEDTMTQASLVFEDFFIQYGFLIEDIKEEYLSLPVERYVKIAEYLKGQDIDKWVLNFYEIGRLPMLDSMGEIHKQVNYYYTLSSGGQSSGKQMSSGRDSENPQITKQAIQKLYFDYLMETKKVDEILIDDISKSFLNSGATFHTLLLNPVRRYLSEEFKYEPVATQGEVILKQLARLTGGTVTVSNKMDDFLKEVTVRQDIVYVLSYVPGDTGNKSKLEIKVNGKNYRVVFDNQRRHKTFRGIVREMRKNRKDLEIESLALQNNMLHVHLKHIELVDYENERYGAVRARIKIIDGNKKVVAAFVKTFKGIKENGIFQIPLPELPKGKCKLIVEVKDLFALNSVYAGDAITVD